MKHTPSIRHQAGFTIVELLIVIVVIGILAAITVVAYNGIQNRANDTAVQSDLRNFGTIMAQYKAINGQHPSAFTTDMGIRFTKNAYGLDAQSYNARYCRNSTTDEFILYAKSQSGNYFRYTPNAGIEPAVSTYGWGICTQIGLTETNPQINGRTPSGWASWVN